MNKMSLIMISAMYENGGNTTHRILDGHPELFVYPFESQMGTGYNNDYLASYLPIRYRWSEFPMESTPEADYEVVQERPGAARLGGEEDLPVPVVSHGRLFLPLPWERAGVRVRKREGPPRGPLWSRYL